MEAQLEFDGEDDPSWRFMRDSFGDQIELSGGKVAWKADVVADLLQGGGNEVSLGVSRRVGGSPLSVTSDMLKKSGVSEAEARLIGAVWRSPDTVTKRPDGGSVLSFESADGKNYVLTVSAKHEFLSFKKG